MARPRGRPEALDEQKKQRFIDLLTVGISQNEALVIIGVSEPTVRRERRADANFDDSVKKAHLEGKATLVERVHKASQPGGAKLNWTPAAWLLERKHWREYAARKPDAYTADDLAALGAEFAAVAMEFIPKAQQAAFSERLRELLAGRRKGKGRGR